MLCQPRRNQHEKFSRPGCDRERRNFSVSAIGSPTLRMAREGIGHPNLFQKEKHDWRDAGEGLDCHPEKRTLEVVAETK
jgi:hypothetical protein